MILIQTLNQLTSFPHMPGLHQHMKGYSLSLKQASFLTTGKALEMDMEFDKSSKYPSRYSVKMVSVRFDENFRIESQLTTYPIDLKIPEVNESSCYIDKDGFGLALFHGTGYSFIVSVSREFIPDKKGFQSNRRKQSKDLILKQIREIALKVQPEWKQFIKTWNWKSEIKQELYLRKKSRI